ncbi:MAG: YnfA family protein [Campylobacteraceae bacterium]|jgi:small multidrug resistance family-3 protein|nr:YnfA family protein [Campylobacteraceae bacterium]
MVTKSLLVFFFAGVCEIGGGYLIWLWLREDRHWSVGLLGGCILAFYGVVATWQPSNFARVYAAYGGVFILMSMLWAIKFDSYTPDKYDIIGVLVALVGVSIIYFTPRA